MVNFLLKLYAHPLNCENNFPDLIFFLTFYCRMFNFFIVDINFEPSLINKEVFLDYYKDKGLMDIINGLSWVTESFGVLDQIKRDPANTTYKDRFSRIIIPELKKEPLGEKAFTRLNEIEIFIKVNSSLETLEDKLDLILHELSKGYRVLLQRYTAR